MLHPPYRVFQRSFSMLTPFPLLLPSRIFSLPFLCSILPTEYSRDPSLCLLLSHYSFLPEYSAYHSYAPSSLQSIPEILLYAYSFPTTPSFQYIQLTILMLHPPYRVFQRSFSMLTPFPLLLPSSIFSL